MRGRGEEQELWEGSEGLGESKAVEELTTMLFPIREELAVVLFPACLRGRGAIGKGRVIQLRIRRRRQDCRSIRAARLSF